MGPKTRTCNDVSVMQRNRKTKTVCYSVTRLLGYVVANPAANSVLNTKRDSRRLVVAAITRSASLSGRLRKKTKGCFGWARASLAA